MTIHRISIDDFISSDYELIAIHSGLEDYRVAFFLNQALGTQLSKCKEEIEINTGQIPSYFSHYLFEDCRQDIIWNLASNKTFFSTNSTSPSPLFKELNPAFFTPIYLLPELKKVDFILKIENTDHNFDIENVIDKINALKSITTAYELQENTIKSKNNLIF